MKCDICGKEIIYKKDLVAGPLNRAKSLSISAAMGRNIRKVHKSCLKNISAKERTYSKGKIFPFTILPMNGIYGIVFIIIPLVMFLVAFIIILLGKLSTSNKVLSIIIFLIVIMIFEIVLIRLRLKIKKEYEDKLQ